MDDKELYEILKKYAEDTRCEKKSVFKKLNEKPQEEVKCSRKRFKPQYAFVIAMCMIVIVLCIALPVTLTKSSQVAPEPIYCWGEEIKYQTEESISSIIDAYHINANYPTYVADTEDMAIYSIISKKDESLHGVQISYIVEDDGMIFIDLVIIPKTHILQTYEGYFSLQNKLAWTDYYVKFYKEYNEETLMNDMQMYFTDEKYDYFIAIKSDDEIEPADILDILYS